MRPDKWFLQEAENARSREFKESGVRSQESGVRSQESGVRSQESGVRSQESGVRSQEPGARSQEPGARSQEPGARSQVQSPTFATRKFPESCIPFSRPLIDDPATARLYSLFTDY